MALATAVISYDIADMVGTDFDASRTKVWVSTNVPGDAVIDTVGNAIRLGDGKGTIAPNGTGSVSVWIPGAGSNPASWQTYVHVDYVPKRKGAQHTNRTFGPFTVSGSSDLADLIAEQEIPPTYVSTVTALLDGYVDDAEAAATDARSAADLSANRAAAAVLAGTASNATAAATARDAAQAAAALAEDISNIGVPDGLVATLVNDDNSDTRTSLGNVFAGKDAQALAAPTMQRVTRTEVAFGQPRFIEQFDGYLWGVDGSTGDIYRSTDGVTWAPYCNSWPGVGVEGFISRIIPTDDGEVIAMSEHQLRKSTGWATGNAATWTATKIVPNGSCTLNALDGNGTKFIVNEYNSTPADWDQSRYAHISLDGGDTWTMRYDSQALHGVSASNESHLHGACYDRWADVFYNGEGHGAAGGVYYSADDGLTWGGPLNVSDDDTNAPTVIKATDNGIVMGSDNGQNGLFGMLRKTNPAEQVITRTWAFNPGREGLVMFAQSALRDPATGMVFISFRSEFNDVPVVLAAGTAASGGLVYELPDLPVIGGADRFSAIGLINASTLLLYGEVQGVPHHFIGEVGRPGQGSAVLDDSNLDGGGGGRTGGFASALAGGRSTAQAVQATSYGQGATADFAGATALGYGATATGTSATVAGQSSTAASGAAVYGALASAGAEGVAVGISADAGASGTALGPNATAFGSSVALGLNSITTDGSGTAIGNTVSAMGAAATAVGHQASATASSTAVGKSATAGGGAVAFGQNSSATVGDVAIGFGSNAGHAGSVALGGNASTTQINQVMIGARDLEILTSGRGLIEVSPNGTRWRLAVTDAGTTVWNGL